MSRRLLSGLVGVFGFLLAAAMLVLLLIMGSLFADARSSNITGPGVDVFLRTPFPGEHGTIVLDVEARGGSRAGIIRANVSSGARTLAEVNGGGTSWGTTIVEGKGRGSETVTLRFPATESAGQIVPLTIDVSYVVAMSGGGGFTNERHDDAVNLDVTVYDDAGRHVAQAKQVGIALGCFAIWFLIVWGVAFLYARAEGEASYGEAAKTEAIGLLMGIMGGGAVGYWMFAWRIMNLLETQETAWAVVLTGAWLVIPLAWAWFWSKRQDKKRTPVKPAGGGGFIVGSTGFAIGHDAALPSPLILEMSKSRVASLAERAPSLAEVATWIEAMLADPIAQGTKTVRRRIVALNWVLVAAQRALHDASTDPATREGLIRAIHDATAVADDDDRERLADRVKNLVHGRAQ